MDDFVVLPHFQIVLTREFNLYTWRQSGVTIVAHNVARGWELTLVAKDGARFSIEVEGHDLAGAESQLVKAMGRAEDALTAAIMQASAECRHGEVRA